MDGADRAAELERVMRDSALAEHQRARPPRVNTTTCLSCGDPIAPARLAAQPGCAWCLDCQTKYENGATR